MHLTDWLPTTKKEIELRHWDTLDVILFSGDAYVDHPSFAAAVIGRLLEQEGLRVCTSFIEDHQYDMLEERMKIFEINNPR